jgi:hypothetical protein
MAHADPFESRPQAADFWSQAPVVLFTAAAVLAILFVNARTQAAGLDAPPAERAPVAQPAPSCVDCGEVVAVRAAGSAAGQDAARAEATVWLDVRMQDGTIRTVRHFAPGFDVGDRVLVNGNALVVRG